MRALRLGRITALQKPDKGVRGIVVGEFIRRLVARTVAKQFSEQAQEATAPYQHALETRAGVRVRGTRHPSIDGFRR